MSQRPEQRERPLSPPLSPRLSIYRWHPGMIASIAHRASGLTLVLLAPACLWLLHDMGSSAENFTVISNWLHSGLGKFFLWLAGVALIYHFCNGIRFLTIDAGWGESRSRLRSGATMAIGVSVFAALLLAVLLCIV